MSTKKFGIDFESLKLDGYRNINELYRQHNQLHACETLFGDWNAEVMLLAQDAANFNTLQELKTRDDKNPFRHSPENRTNKNLFGILNSLDKFDLGAYDAPNNRSCGLYYANAIWLLKDSRDMSGAITNLKESYKINGQIFNATINNLKKLKLIITLGDHSFQFLKNFFKDQISMGWHQTVADRMVHKVHFNGSTYFICSVYHTSTRGMVARAKLNGFIGKDSCIKGIEITKNDLELIFASNSI
jgi:hypothetical protein